MKREIVKITDTADNSVAYAPLITNNPEDVSANFQNLWGMREGEIWALETVSAPPLVFGRIRRAIRLDDSIPKVQFRALCEIFRIDAHFSGKSSKGRGIWYLSTTYDNWMQGLENYLFDCIKSRWECTIHIKD